MSIFYDKLQSNKTNFFIFGLDNFCFNGTDNQIILSNKESNIITKLTQMDTCNFDALNLDGDKNLASLNVSTCNKCNLLSTKNITSTWNLTNLQCNNNLIIYKTQIKKDNKITVLINNENDNNLNVKSIYITQKADYNDSHLYDKNKKNIFGDIEEKNYYGNFDKGYSDKRKTISKMNIWWKDGENYVQPFEFLKYPVDQNNNPLYYSREIILPFKNIERVSQKGCRPSFWLSNSKVHSFNNSLIFYRGDDGGLYYRNASEPQNTKNRHFLLDSRLYGIKYTYLLLGAGGGTGGDGHYMGGSTTGSGVAGGGGGAGGFVLLMLSWWACANNEDYFRIEVSNENIRFYPLVGVTSTQLKIGKGGKGSISGNSGITGRPQPGTGGYVSLEAGATTNIDKNTRFPITSSNFQILYGDKGSNGGGSNSGYDIRNKYNPKEDGDSDTNNILYMLQKEKSSGDFTWQDGGYSIWEAGSGKLGNGGDGGGAPSTVHEGTIPGKSGGLNWFICVY